MRNAVSVKKFAGNTSLMLSEIKTFGVWGTFSESYNCVYASMQRRKHGNASDFVCCHVITTKALGMCKRPVFGLCIILRSLLFVLYRLLHMLSFIY